MGPPAKVSRALPAHAQGRRALWEGMPPSNLSSSIPTNREYLNNVALPLADPRLQFLRERHLSFDVDEYSTASEDTRAASAEVQGPPNLRDIRTPQSRSYTPTQLWTGICCSREFCSFSISDPDALSLKMMFQVDGGRAHKGAPKPWPKSMGHSTAMGEKSSLAGAQKNKAEMLCFPGSAR